MDDSVDLIFPPRVIPSLRDLRGEQWKALIEQVMAENTLSRASLSFILLMSRLGNCPACQIDSFRALRGCPECARQTVRRYRGDDQTLLQLYRTAQTDLERFFQPVVGPPTDPPLPES